MAFSGKNTKYCLELVRKYDYNNYLCSLFQPNSNIRDCVMAFRAFNIETANIQDVVKEPKIAELRMQWWKQMITDTFQGRPVDHPVSLEIAKCLEHTSFSKMWFLKVLNERENHLQRTTFSSLEQLESYAEETASSLFYLHLEALGIKNRNLEHACGHLGKSLGITTILRSIPYSLPDLFIPSEILIKNGVASEDVIRNGPKASGNFKDAIYEVATRANDQLLTAKSFIQEETLGSPEIAALLPLIPLQLFLNQLEKADFDIFSAALNRKSLYLPYAIWKASRNSSEICPI